MKDLKNYTTSNAEHGYLLQTSNGVVKGYHFQGEEGKADINFNLAEKIDGIIHSHYTGLLSTFSVADVLSLAVLYKSNAMRDMSSFIAGVVTASGTNYYLMIDDEEKFKTFAENCTIGNEINKSVQNFFEWLYLKNYKISENTSPSSNEINFTRFLQMLNTGLKVVKLDTTTDKLQVISLDENNNIILDDCIN